LPFSKFPHWVAFDMQQVIKVKDVILAMRTAVPGNTFREFMIQGSMDGGVTWTDYPPAEGSYYIFEPIAEEKQTFSLPSVPEMRQIRIFAVSAHNQNFAVLGEIEVFGSYSDTEAPEWTLDYVNITGDKLKNTGPFERGPRSEELFTLSGGAQVRYSPKDWTVNDQAIRNGMVGDNADPDFKLPSMVFIAHSRVDLGFVTTITNAKAYQTIELEAGTYRFHGIAAGQHTPINGGGFNVGFIAAALGSDFPDTNVLSFAAADLFLPSSALVYNFYPSQNIVPPSVNQSISFVLTEKTTVSLGFVSSLQNTTGNTQVFIDSIQLWKLQ